MSSKDSAAGDYFTQLTDTLLVHREASRFIIKHKLWEGFWKYGWVSSLLIGVAIIFGFKFFSIIKGWFSQFQSSTTNPIAEMGLLVEHIALDSYNFLFTGSFKYIMLRLLEIIIFHVCRRTMQILTGDNPDFTIKSFIDAQIRMLKITIRTYFLEMAFTILAKIFFGIFHSVDVIEPIFLFGLQCYFLGFLILDNYNEQFDMTIKESGLFARDYIGVSLAAGLILNLLLFIPVIGAIVGPMLAAVAVTIIMYRYTGKRYSLTPPPFPED